MSDIVSAAGLHALNVGNVPSLKCFERVHGAEAEWM